MKATNPITVSDLLAIIHRDGGHYQDKHGLEETLRRAAQIVVNERARADLNDRMLCEQVIRQALKLENYEKALGRIAEGDPTPLLVARAVLAGHNWDVK